MTAECVIELLDILGSYGVKAWIDGGWGIDALIGRQSRPHDDLDLVVALADLNQIREGLSALGFRIFEDHLPIRFTIVHPKKGKIDFHTVTFDEKWGGVQPQPDGGTFRYPPEGFTSGTLLTHKVPCISAEVQLLCHLGYVPTGKDFQDVLLLHQEFGIRLPPLYKPFAG